jgi:hypothetical protein
LRPSAGSVDALLIERPTGGTRRLAC